MILASYTWAIFTVLGAGGQVVRNALQRSLTQTLGTVGATHVRFLFGMPFAYLFLAGILAVTGDKLPALSGASIGYTFLGALAQVIATAMMLAAMKEKSFVVTTALIKTEPVHAALFGLAFLGDPLTFGLVAAMALCMTGVYFVSIPQNLKINLLGERAVWTGLIAGAAFGASAVGYRAGILALNHPNFVTAASVTLCVGLTMQAGLLTAWLGATDRPVLAAIFRAWRPSLAAGFTGAFASQFWFLAFAIASVAHDRTLALIEILFAQIISRRMYAQNASRREMAGVALIAVGVVVLLNLQR